MTLNDLKIKWEGYAEALKKDDFTSVNFYEEDIFFSFIEMCAHSDDDFLVKNITVVKELASSILNIFKRKYDANNFDDEGRPLDKKFMNSSKVEEFWFAESA